MSKLIVRLWAIWLMIGMLLVGCQAKDQQRQLTSQTAFSGIYDFGDPNAVRFKQRLRALNNNKTGNEVVTITQFGDSHSAADFFTGELRNLMQTHFGDAGIGWVTPMAISGQHHTGVSWKSKNWQVVSSRNTTGRDFPMGGYIAEPSKDNGYLQVIPNQQDTDQRWQVRMMVKPLKLNAIQAFDAKNAPLSLRLPAKLNHWQTVNLTTSAPFQIKAKVAGAELGSFWLQKANRSGVIVSPIATNGAKLAIWQKWSTEWLTELSATKSDLVILEYGTNESFESSLSLNDYRQTLVQSIRQIRKQLPKAAILLLSSPDTMMAKSEHESCQDRQPPFYQAVRSIQQSVAKSEKLLYWDWQTAMGGDCIIETWQIMDLARPDLVHLTRQGYAQSAKMLYRDLLQFIQQ